MVPVMSSNSVTSQLSAATLPINCCRCGAALPLLALQNIIQAPQACLVLPTSQAQGCCLTTDVRCRNAGGCCDPHSITEVFAVHCAEVTNDPVQKEGLQGCSSPSARGDTSLLATSNSCATCRAAMPIQGHAKSIVCTASPMAGSV